MLRHEDFTPDLVKLSFDFFYWFSRIEFALKENDFLRSGIYGEAKPDWRKFSAKFSGSYTPCQHAVMLLQHPPKCQAVENGSTSWKKLNFNRKGIETELDRVVLAVQTIRNNLFHGGKHSQEDYDNPARNIFLLSHGRKVIDSLSSLGDLKSDYERWY